MELSDQATPPKRRRPLKIGIQLPIVEPGDVADSKDRLGWTAILGMARLAERVGLDSVWIPDHLLFRRSRSPGTSEGIWEGWSILAALAAATERITLGTMVTCTAFRNPALLAQMAVTVDEIAGGRLILGLGAGWHQPEFQAFGVPFDHRVERFGEAIHIIRALFRDGEIDFRGAYYRLERCTIGSGRSRPQGPPIMVGTTGPRMLRLTARYADMWNAGIISGRSWADAVPPLNTIVDTACAAVGRDPATLTRTINPLLVFPSEEATPWPAGAEPLTGSAEELAAALADFALEGISHVQLLLEPNTGTSIESLGPILALLDR